MAQGDGIPRLPPQLRCTGNGEPPRGARGLTSLCALLAWRLEWRVASLAGRAAGRVQSPNRRPTRAPGGCASRRMRCVSAKHFKRLSGGVFLPRGAYFIYPGPRTQPYSHSYRLHAVHGILYAHNYSSTCSAAVRQSPRHVLHDRRHDRRAHYWTPCLSRLNSPGPRPPVSDMLCVVAGRTWLGLYKGQGREGTFG